MGKRAVIYTRVSTDEQAERGSGLETQLESCRAWAQDNDFSIIAEVSDDFTGTSLERPGFDKVMELVEAGHTDALIVHSADRLSRNLVHRVIIRDELQKANVQLIYHSRGVIGNSPTERFLDNIEGVVAEYEIELIKERMMRGKRAKAKKGIPIGHGHPPFGYQVVGTKQDTKFEIVEKEAEIVRLIYQLYLDEDMKLVDIADYLTERRIPSRGDNGSSHNKKRGAGQWSIQMVRIILHNEVYTGVWHAFRYKREGKKVTQRPKEKWIPIRVPVIIPKQRWQKVKEKVRRTPTKRRKHNYLLSGRIRCACGYSVGSRPKYNGYKTYLYYSCTAKGRHNLLHQCDAPQFKTPLVDGAVWQWVENLLCDPETIMLGLDGLREEASRQNKTLLDRISFLESQIGSKSRKLDRLLGLYLDEKIPKSVLDDKSVEMSTMIDKMKNEMESLETQVQSFPSDAEVLDMADMISQVGEIIPIISFEDKRRIIELLDVQATLSYEDGVRYVDMQCLIGDNFVSLTSSTSKGWRPWMLHKQITA